VHKILRLGRVGVVGELDLAEIVMLLYGHVFDGAVNDVDFSVYLKKPCQVKFLEKLNYFHFHGLVGYGYRNYAALTP
jgi:hypothetical protein